MTSNVYKLPVTANIPWNVIDPKTELVAVPGENPQASFCSGAPGGFSNFLKVNIPWDCVENATGSSSRNGASSRTSIQGFQVFLVPIKEEEMVTLTTKIEMKKRYAIGSLSIENKRYSDVYDVKGNKRDPKREWFTVSSGTSKKKILEVKKLENPLAPGSDLKINFKILATSGQHEKARFSILIVPLLASSSASVSQPVFISEPIYVMTKKNNTGSQAVTTFVCERINQAVSYIQTQKASQTEIDENGKNLIAESIIQLINLVDCANHIENVKRGRDDFESSLVQQQPGKVRRVPDASQEADEFPVIDFPPTLNPKSTSSNRSSLDLAPVSSARSLDPIITLSGARQLAPFGMPSRGVDPLPFPSNATAFNAYNRSFLPPTSTNSLRPINSSSLGVFANDYA